MIDMTKVTINDKHGYPLLEYMDEVNATHYYYPMAENGMQKPQLIEGRPVQLYDGKGNFVHLFVPNGPYSIPFLLKVVTRE